jgi:hypothetical protein
MNIPPTHVAPVVGMTRDEMIRAAAQEWYSGQMQSPVAMMIIYGLLNPRLPNDEDLKWAREALRAERKRTCGHQWVGGGAQPAKWYCTCGAVIYRSREDAVDD